MNVRVEGERRRVLSVEVKDKGSGAKWTLIPDMASLKEVSVFLHAEVGMRDVTRVKTCALAIAPYH